MKRVDKWKLLIAATLVGATAVGLLASGQTNQEADVALQAAIHKERVDGELEQAIQQYKTIVSKYKANRPVAAQALLHMGQCYERLGAGEAQKAYEQLLREYTDQTEVLNIARERLALLSGAKRNAGVELAVRKVWSDKLTDTMGEVSPDGKFLSFVDWDTGDLAIRDLQTGKNRRLTDKGTWEKSQDFALFSRWSPDGRQIAYDWYVDRPGKTPNFSVEVRVITVSDLSSRVLYQTKGQREDVETSDWSRDGKSIVVGRTFNGGASNDIVVLSSVDSRPTVVKTVEGDWPWPIVFSPDGRSLVYSCGNPERNVFLVSADGTEASQLIGHPADDVALAWTPDGRNILFVSDRSGSLDLWSLPVSGGKAIGEARLIKSAVGRAAGLGVTPEGVLYLGNSATSFDVYIASIESETGRVQGKAAKVAARYEGVNDWPAYSPDGKRLAYVSARRSGARPFYNVLCIKSLATGEEREFQTEFLRLAGTRWAQDGRTVYLGAFANDKRWTISRIDAQTGAVTTLVRAEENQMFRHHEVPDEKSLIYIRSDMSSRTSSIVRRDLESGREQVLYEGPPRVDLVTALSPDRRQLAFLSYVIGQGDEDRVLRVMPVAGGKPRDLFRFDARGSAWSPLAWSADGTHLMFAKRTSFDAAKYDLWRVSMDGANPEKLDFQLVRFHGISPHPDGKQFAFGGMAEQRPSEVWVVENLLLELNKSKP